MKENWKKRAEQAEARVLVLESGLKVLKLQFEVLVFKIERLKKLLEQGD